MIVIEGVDTAYGIEALGGDEALYFEVLASFCKDIEKWREIIVSYPASAPLKSFITSVHGFKSAARAIGAGSAGDYAFEIEKAAKNGDLAAVSAGQGALVSVMNDLFARCKAAVVEVCGCD